MKYLNYLGVLLFFALTQTSCLVEEFETKRAAVKKDDNSLLEVREYSQYDYLYTYVYNDQSYRELLKTVNVSQIDFFDSDLENKLSTYESSVPIRKISEYWEKPIFMNGDRNANLLALFDATNDIVSLTDDIGNTEGCTFDYGIFEISSLTLLNCEEVEIDLGCCAGLYCEVNNCGVEAYLELAADLDISPNESMMVSFGALFSGLIRSSKGAKISLQTYLVAKFLVGVVHVGDLFKDLTTCIWDMTFNYSEWTQRCDCTCPTIPQCDYETDLPQGGFIYLQDCL